MSEVLPRNFGRNFDAPFEPLDILAHLDVIAHNPEQRFSYHQRQGALENTAVVLLTPEHSQEIIDRMALYELQSGLYEPEALYLGLLRGGNQFTMRFASALAETAVDLSTRRNLPDFAPHGVHPHVNFMNAGRYGSSQHGGAKLKISQHLPDDERTAGRTVNACDDVVDEGITLTLLDPYFIEGLRRVGLLKIRREEPSTNFGVRAFSSKGIADLSGLDPRQVVIGCKGPNVWYSEMGMDGERIITVRGIKKVQKEIKRHHAGLSVPTVQDVKYEESTEELMQYASERDLSRATINDITFIDTSKKSRRRFVGRFIDLSDLVRAA